MQNGCFNSYEATTATSVDGTTLHHQRAHDATVATGAWKRAEPLGAMAAAVKQDQDQDLSLGLDAFPLMVADDLSLLSFTGQVRAG